MPIFHSVREAVGSLFEQLPGDIVQLRTRDLTAPQVVGRVLSPDDPQLEGKIPVQGRVFVAMPSGEIQEFDSVDLEKIRPEELPGDQLASLYGQPDVLATEVLDDVDGDAIAEVIDLDAFTPPRGRSLGRADPERSMAARLAQRMPLTRNKKSRAMRRNWRRAKSRSGAGMLGNEPSGTLGTFESLIEQETALGSASINLDGPNKSDDIRFGQDVKKVASDAVNPREAYVQTSRVFEAANEIMLSLSTAKGASFFHSIADDPDKGYIRIKLNGTAPKGIVEQFVRNIGDVDISLVEKPKGTEADNDLRGWWVFEARLPDFEEYEEDEYQEPKPADDDVERGALPGEVVIPETSEPGMEL